MFRSFEDSDNFITRGRISGSESITEKWNPIHYIRINQLINNNTAIKKINQRRYQPYNPFFRVLGCQGIECEEFQEENLLAQ